MIRLQINQSTRKYPETMLINGLFLIPVIFQTKTVKKAKYSQIPTSQIKGFPDFLYLMSD